MKKKEENRSGGYLLLKLSEPFFDTTVGPRPNLARMCG